MSRLSRTDLADAATWSGLEASFTLPPFVVDAVRRVLVAVLCCVVFLHLTRQSGHPGATGEETLDSTPSLGELYQRVRSGALSPGTGEGQWWFGLATARESVAL